MYETIEQILGLAGHHADPNLISIICAITYLSVLTFIWDVLVIFIKFLFCNRR